MARLATISDEYLAEQRTLHANPRYGVASIGYAPLVADLLRIGGFASLSDYGAGKCNLQHRLRELGRDRFDYRPYDPAFPEYGPPRPGELTTCIDVLEHVEPDHLGGVLDELAAMTRRLGLFTVHTGPAVKTLSDGRNAHIIQQPADWWRPHFARRFDVVHLQPVPKGFFVLVAPREAAEGPPLDRAALVRAARASSPRRRGVWRGWRGGLAFGADPGGADPGGVARAFPPRATLGMAGAMTTHRIDKAIILSAGQGSRLLPLTADRPKCLIDFSGRSLLAWQVDGLAAAGVREVHVVTGFMTALVEEELARLGRPGLAIHVHFNPFFKVADNLGSCWIARDAMVGDFLLLNGDTLVSPPIVERVLETGGWPIQVTVDAKPNYDSDDMKVTLAGDRLLAIGKTIPAEHSPRRVDRAARLSRGGRGAVPRRRARRHAHARRG